jgi:putative transposase
MMRTASIRLSVTPEQAAALEALRSAYAQACNQLVPIVRAHRVWNRVGLHQRAYRGLRESTPTIEANGVSLNTLKGRVSVPWISGAHQRRILQSGRAKEADLVLRDGQWFFNLVVQSEDPQTRASGPAMGVDVGENILAATSTGKVWGGESLRHQRDRYLALRTRLQSNGSQSARQKLRQVSGKERRRVRHVNHETSKAIVQEALRAGVAKIRMEDLTHIRERIRAGKRLRRRLHRWAFRQLQTFVEYKARAAGIAVEYVEPAYTSRTCAACGGLGERLRHRFVCQQCGLRAHADLNASRNLARIGESALSPRAAVNTPDVGDRDSYVQVSP